MNFGEEISWNPGDGYKLQERGVGDGKLLVKANNIIIIQQEMDINPNRER